MPLLRFLSTPSARRATEFNAKLAEAATISIHALREEGDPALPAKIPGSRISIHALREEGDVNANNAQLEFTISIHALREEGDGKTVLYKLCRKRFLSTPSARRATGRQCAVYRTKKFLAPPSAWRATRICRFNGVQEA